MSARTSTNSLKSVKVVCKNLRGSMPDVDDINDRQLKVPGFDQKKLDEAIAAVIGGGGLMGPVLTGSLRKGLGEIHEFDGDTVELANLNRQNFTDLHIGKNKAISLAYNSLSDGYMGSTIIAYPYYFQEALERGLDVRFDVIVCGVDNDDTRVFVSRYGLDHGIPVVFSAVSDDANHGYVFVQQVGGACFGCAFPRALIPHPTPCPGTPAAKDILNVMSGFSLYAIDSLLMDRKRTWNYRMIHLAGYAPDSKQLIERNPECPLCGVVEEPIHETT